MNALVIGYGSIGQRHARILGEMGHKVSVVSKSEQNDLVVYHTLKEALNNQYQYIVIANETSKHVATLKELIDSNFKGIILVEKPLFFKNEIIDTQKNSVYVAYNLRFHPLFEKLEKLLVNEKIMSVNAYVGQYLPTWRLNTDYSKGYSAFKEQGGGVLRDLSHELDYLTMLFGKWISLVAISSKISDLNIDSEDYVQVKYETEKQVQVSVELNYLDRIIQRYMTIQTFNKTIKVDFIQNTINCNGEVSTFTEIDRDYTYRKQHEAVLINSDKCCSYMEGIAVMQMIEAIEKSSELKEWVYND